MQKWSEMIFLPKNRYIRYIRMHARPYISLCTCKMSQRHSDLPEAGLNTPQNILSQVLPVTYSQRAQCRNGRFDRWEDQGTKVKSGNCVSENRSRVDAIETRVNTDRGDHFPCQKHRGCVAPRAIRMCYTYLHRYILWETVLVRDKNVRRSTTGTEW